MNPELYERYLAKKAKKLGISVEELKAQSEDQKPRSQEGKLFNNSSPSNLPIDTNLSSFNTNEMLNSLNSLSPRHLQINDTRENKFCLIGYPLGHSLSKVIQEAGFKSLGINANYELLETPVDTLVDRIKFLKTNGYKGFNVTIPLKLPVSLFVDEVDKYADLSRAVNTIYIQADKTLKGYNTDVIGFKRAIPSDIDLRGKKAGILGTGGAAHAVFVALAECGIKQIDFFTRNIPNSIDLMNYVRRIFPSIIFNVYQIENIRNLNEYDILVNTTPIGMLGKYPDMMPVEISALETLNKDAVVYDCIYNPKKTLLIKNAQKLGLKTITGLDMLIYQAKAAQEIWLGSSPDFKDMKISALEEI